MGNEWLKTEHNGPKNGGGADMRRSDAKCLSKRQRRREGRKLAYNARTLYDATRVDDHRRIMVA